MKIGIIGQGFVGNAVYQKFKEAYEVLTYDLDESKCNSTLKNVIDNCIYIFVCLPTPMGKEGECDLSILINALDDISEIAQDKKIIILKSTIPPGTSDSIMGYYDNLCICFNPEFLTAINAVEDFASQDRIIIGGYKKYAKEIGKIYRKLFPKTKIVYTSNEIAEMTKYVINTFLALKVSYANEIYEFCYKKNLPYDEIIKYACLDKRLGKSHWKVPGPDGKFGFGGACFPGNYSVLTKKGKISLEKIHELFLKGKKLNIFSFNHDLINENIKKINNVTKRYYEGELIKFTLENNSILECTPEHIFPILRNNKLILVQAKDIQYDDIFYEYINRKQ